MHERPEPHETSRSGEQIRGGIRGSMTRSGQWAVALRVFALAGFVAAGISSGADAAGGAGPRFVLVRNTVDSLEELRRSLHLVDPPPGAARSRVVLGRHEYTLGTRGLEVHDLDRPRARPERHPGIRGTDFEVVGRRLYVAAPDGVRAYRDVGAVAVTYQVVVGNDFFSPSFVEIQVGDTVRWGNSTNENHNVRSCVPDQTGCADEATESFTSGSPSGFWAYSHTFTGSGSNPYVCQPHALHMSGRIDVVGDAATPPPVPDGTSGNPMTVWRLDADGATLALDWDVASCTGAADHHILYGSSAGLPSSPGGAYELDGAVCSVGTSPPWVWRGAPSDPGGFLWWVVVAGDGSAAEGSWGENGQGAERNGPLPDGASGECGATAKSLANACD